VNTVEEMDGFLSMEEAERAERDARAIFEEYDRALRNGESGNRQEWADALTDVQFAERQLEGARVRAEREADQKRRADALALHEEMRETFAATTTDIRKKYETLVKAIGKTFASVMEHNQARERLHARLEELRPPEVSLNAPTPDFMKAAVDFGTHEIESFRGLSMCLAAMFEALSPQLGRLNPNEAAMLRSYDGTTSREAKVVREIAEHLTIGHNKQ
jgi:hypothetical protein